MMEYNFQIPELSQDKLDTKLEVINKGDKMKLGTVEVSKNETGSYIYDFKLEVMNKLVHVVAESMTLSTSGIIEYDSAREDKPGRVLSFSA